MKFDKKCPLVLIEWSDSRQPTGVWQRLSEFNPAKPCKCVSVGFLIHDGKKNKTLAPNMADIEDEQNIQASGIIHIPARSVTRIKRITENG